MHCSVRTLWLKAQLRPRTNSDAGIRWSVRWTGSGPRVVASQTERPTQRQSYPAPHSIQHTLTRKPQAKTAARTSLDGNAVGSPPGRFPTAHDFTNTSVRLEGQSLSLLLNGDYWKI